MVSNRWRTFSFLLPIDLNKGHGSEGTIMNKAHKKLIRLKLNIFAQSLKLKNRELKEGIYIINSTTLS